MKKKDFYFSTRDLMMMAALSALGGITGTYVNMIGDLFQSMLGFAGTTQWAAGLHVIWLMLASAIIRKPGAATLTGIMKGFVELMTGNTHGILVVIVDIVAGLIVDLVLLFSHKEKNGLLFLLAAGFSAASNVIVFQIFASLPADILALAAIFGISAMAFVSGIIFGGWMTRSLAAGLEKLGVIRPARASALPSNAKIWVGLAILAAISATMLGGYAIYSSQNKVAAINIGGDVEHAYEYPTEAAVFEERNVSIESNGVAREYQGVLIKDLIMATEPWQENGVVMIEASDGYSFFVSMDEIETNPNLLLTMQESENALVFNVVGAVSSKAWVRGVARLVVMPKNTLEVSGNLENPYIFTPQEWQERMDSIYFSIDDAQEKLQGVPLEELVVKAEPMSAEYQVVVSGSTGSATFEASEITGNADVRLFTYPKEGGFEFILGNMNGTIILRQVERIEIQ